MKSREVARAVRLAALVKRLIVGALYIFIFIYGRRVQRVTRAGLHEPQPGKHPGKQHGEQPGGPGSPNKVFTSWRRASLCQAWRTSWTSILWRLLQSA
ncbi:hypothetical protein EVAR_85181_1 [Eumeta japonica]|uniref:Uncharacterized protein n=1 Tax=Eumeta variegata TaxID=151549 RepID=A0A4C1W1N4_EUMVA|nr:hypothetical protein EVAR_85181_1 [Eumeta japonica]